MRLITYPILWLLRGLQAVTRGLYLLLRGYNALHLRVHGTLTDTRSLRSALAYLTSPRRPGPTLLSVLSALERARKDPRLELVLVELGPLNCGLARAEEVREALARVRDAGVRVCVVMEEAGLQEYWAALGGSRIRLAPAGSLNLTGISSELVFARGLLDKAGVQAQLEARGKYKSAREIFTREAPSEANREMTEALVGDLYEQLVGNIARHRGIGEEKVREILDRGPFRAEQAREAGLIDEIGYADELKEKLKEEFKPWRPVEGGIYLQLSVSLAGEGRAIPIALLEVCGTIKSGQTLPGQDQPRATGSRSFTAELRRAVEDSRVKAVVLRVDSPGGSGLASDVMWHALLKAREKKPVVVSMANLGASGGYFIACLKGAPLFASASTITGSIGVLGGKFALPELYEKLGVSKTIVSRGERASFYSEYVPFSEEDLEKVREDIDAFYKDFVEKMATGREKSFEEIDKVAQGRVWTGKQARENGLVDRTGGFLEALKEVRRLLNVDENRKLSVVRTPGHRPKWPFRIEPNFDQFPLSEVRWYLEQADALNGERVFAMLPFRIRFR